MEQAIRAITIDAAWQLRMEDKVGSLEKGKYADIVVLDGNPFEVEPEKIADIKVERMMMNGKFTYEAGKTPKVSAALKRLRPIGFGCCARHRIASPRMVTAHLAAS